MNGARWIHFTVDELAVLYRALLDLSGAANGPIADTMESEILRALLRRGGMPR